MPISGFVQGVIGGLAGGFADATFEKHQQEIQQDLARRKFLVDAISDFTKSPRFRPESLPIALGHIDALFGVKPGTGKKGEQKTSDIIKSFAEMINAHPMPGVAQAEGIPATARQESPEGITSVPGSPGSGLPPLPMTAGMFRSNDEMAQEAFNKQLPVLREKARIDKENDDRNRETRIAVEQEKAKNRAALRQSDWQERYKYLDAREQARAERAVEQVKASLDPALDEATKDEIARKRVERDLDLVHDKRLLEVDKLKQGLAESKARVERMGILNARTGQLMTKDEAQAAGMAINVGPFETAKANAFKLYAQADDAALHGDVVKANRLQSEGEAEMQKANALGAELERQHPGRVKFNRGDWPAVETTKGMPNVPGRSSKSSDPMGIR